MSDQQKVSNEYAILCAEAGEIQFNIEALKGELNKRNLKINEIRLAEIAKGAKVEAQPEQA